MKRYNTALRVIISVHLGYNNAQKRQLLVENADFYSLHKVVENIVGLN